MPLDFSSVAVYTDPVIRVDTYRAARRGTAVAKKTFQLKQAADAVGVSTITLKRWFLEGKVDDVQRNRNGWRIFDEQDIRRLLAFKNQVREQQAPYEVSGTTSHCFTVASFFSGIGGLELGF